MEEVQYIGYQTKIAKHIDCAKDYNEFELISFILSHYLLTILL